ncbi:MAG: flagellar protein FlgN [Clostridiales bacterium]|nr:flagellar protein FlgN [Clostridiales bacterium]
MASLIEELIQTLEEETEIYHELIPVSEEKTRVVIKNDLEALSKITDKEQKYVDRIATLEKKRSEVIINIGTVLNRNPGSLTLKKIISLLDKQPKEQSRLETLHDDLHHTVHRLMDINQQNKRLIEASLEMIDFNINVIKSTQTIQTNNYDRGASTKDAVMIQTGTFDARQ